MKKQIDLEAVRDARRRLEAIAAEHPELLGVSSAEEWAEALEEVEQMTKTIQVGVRFSPEVVELIDRFAADETAKLRETLPGMELSRADAVRVLTVATLLERGYDLSGLSEPTTSSKAAGRKRKRASK